MTNARLPYLMGGALVAGFAVLSIMSYNALRSDLSRTTEIMFWSTIKDSTDKNVLGAYLDRYPDGLFASAVKSRIDDIAKGNFTALAAAGAGGNAQQMAALQQAAEEAKAKAQAEADKIVADAKATAQKETDQAKAEAAKQAELARAEAAKQAEQAKAEATKQAEMAKAEAAKAQEMAKAEQAKIEQAKAEAAKQAEMAKAEAAKAQEMAKAEQAKVEQARLEAARAAELAKAEQAKAADQAKAAAAAAAKQATTQVASNQPAANAQVAARPAPAAAPAPAAQPLAMPAPGSSSFVIISSTADGLKKGDRLATSQAIAVPSGTRVVLMDASGKVMTVRGPFTGQLGSADATNQPAAKPTGAFRSVSDASGLLERLGDALRDQPDSPRKVGAFRGVGPSGLGLGAPPADPWAIDVASAGHWCVAADKAVSLTRDANAGFDTITIEAKPSGAKMDVPWPKGQTALQWPASVPVKNGATYELRAGTMTTSVALHMLDQKGATPGQVALWMAEQGCQRQASVMIDSLERGLAGKLFDLEINGEMRSTADYKVGEELKLSIRPSREAYVYCFYRDVQGEVTKIFPSQFDRSAQVGGSGAQSIPGPNWEAPMQLTGPAGASEVQCIALDRDATKQLPAEIAKPGFSQLTPKMASTLMDYFKRVPDANIATASMPIIVTE